MYRVYYSRYLTMCHHTGLHVQPCTVFYDLAQVVLSEMLAFKTGLIAVRDKVACSLKEISISSHLKLLPNFEELAHVLVHVDTQVSIALIEDCNFDLV